MRYLAKGLGFLLACALFGMTVSCTFDLFGQILPEKYWYLPALATAAFDIGVVAWLMTLLHVVENNEQRVIAWIMLVIDFLGVGITAISDVFFYDASRGLIEAMPVDWVRWIILILMIVIVANVAAWMAMHILHPKHLTNTTGIKAATPAPRSVVVREVKPRQISAPMRAPTPKALPAPKAMPTITDEEYADFLHYKAVRKQITALRKPVSAQPVKAATAKPVKAKVAQVAEPAAVEEIEEVEEIAEEAAPSPTNDEVDENDDQAEEIEDLDEAEESDDGQEIDESDEDDEDFEDRADTEEIAVINVAPAKEAVPATAPFYQRLVKAVKEQYGSPGPQIVRGPTRLAKKK